MQRGHGRDAERASSFQGFLIFYEQNYVLSIQISNQLFTTGIVHATVDASKFSFAELVRVQASKNNSVFLIENLA